MMRYAIENLKYDERGLVPVIVQDARTRETLTLAYMNAESLRRTLSEGETWFWSRSRSCFWHKGESSGHTQRVVEIAVDCDADALTILVEPNGPACHTNAHSCFHNQLEGAPSSDSQSDAKGASEKGITGAVLDELYALIESRHRERPEGSYTTYLFAQGLDKILKKVGEESAETIIAAKNEEPQALVAEVSDLIYHLLVLLVERGVKLDDVCAELSTRRGGKQGVE